MNPTEHARTYLRQRLDENRANCTSCGTSDKVCTERVIGLRARSGTVACCAECVLTDTHPAPAPTFQVSGKAAVKTRRRKGKPRSSAVLTEKVPEALMRAARSLCGPDQRVVVESPTSVLIVNGRQ